MLLTDLATCREFSKAQIAELESLREQNLAQAARIKELETLSVTRILIAVVPGDGNGEEVYAKSLDDVERLLTRLSEKAEDYALETVPLRKIVVEQAAQIEVMRNELLLMTRDKWHWQEARDRALSVTPSVALEQFAAKVRSEAFETAAKLVDDMEVEKTNYCMQTFEEGKKFQCDAVAAIREMAKEKQNATD